MFNLGYLDVVSKESFDVPFTVSFIKIEQLESIFSEDYSLLNPPILIKYKTKDGAIVEHIIMETIEDFMLAWSEAILYHSES